MLDISSGFTGPDSPTFLNVTAPTEILLCEETLEMILTATTILPLSRSLPLVACYIFPLPPRSTLHSVCLPVLMSSWREWPLSFGSSQKWIYSESIKWRTRFSVFSPHTTTSFGALKGKSTLIQLDLDGLSWCHQERNTVTASSAKVQKRKHWKQTWICFMVYRWL